MVVGEDIVPSVRAAAWGAEGEYDVGAIQGALLFIADWAGDVPFQGVMPGHVRLETSDLIMR